MHNLSSLETQQVSGGGLIGAVIAGALINFGLFSGISYANNKTDDITKPENIAAVGIVGTLVGALSYLAGTMI